MGVRGLPVCSLHRQAVHPPSWGCMLGPRSPGQSLAAQLPAQKVDLLWRWHVLYKMY